MAFARWRGRYEVVYINLPFKYILGDTGTGAKIQHFGGTQPADHIVDMLMS